MFLVFRILRNCVTKNSCSLYNIAKTDQNEILNYLKNFTTFDTNCLRLAQTKNRICGNDCIRNTFLLNFFQKYCQINLELEFLKRKIKIDDISVTDSMGNSLARRRRRRTKLQLKQNAKDTKKEQSGKKQLLEKKSSFKKKSPVKKKKSMYHFWPNFQQNSFFRNCVSNSTHPFGNPFPTPQVIQQFPPLNPNLQCNFVPPSGYANYSQYWCKESKSYSDVVKAVTALQSEGTDLKQFLAETRQIVYTPFGEWVKEGGYKDKADGVFVKILSYNILAQNLLDMHPYLYQHHKKEHLDWEYRKNALLKEFEEFDADILCLQEVEGKETDFFNQHLESLGYKGIYKKRTNDKEDGCAIYYRVEKFELKEYATVEYYQPGIQLLNRDNIGLVARLSPKATPDKNIVVANTHLLFNPKRHDIKLAQVQILLAEIDRIAYKSQTSQTSSHSPYHPIVLVGDFNLKPFTYVYELIVNGYLENIRYISQNRRFSDYQNPNQLMPMDLGITDACQHYEVVKHRIKSRTEISDFKFVRLFNSDRKSLSVADKDSERKEKMNYKFFGSGCLYHNLNFTSVYSHDHLKAENATTFQGDWCNVDYIFYGPQRRREDMQQDGELKLVSFLRLPTKQEAETLKFIPNEVCASDHLPLLATFFLPSF